jgi:hypothetical protein
LWQVKAVVPANGGKDVLDLVDEFNDVLHLQAVVAEKAKGLIGFIKGRD